MNGLRLGRLFGIRIVAAWSLAFIFVLITANLGAGVLPAWHPDWGPGLRWGVAAAAALLFFASVLAHEMSHALVGRAFGIEVKSITLFIFGGMANLEREPTSPRGELLMAIVGPLTSLALGAAFALGGAALGGVSSELVADDPEGALRRLGPAATLLLWLGPVNVMLGLFNLVPGFPLDGGRVLRAVLWGATRDLRRATRWASGAGQAVGWLLVGAGMAMVFGARLPVLGSGTLSGIWIAFIGWFLASAASASYRQLVVSELLEGVPVRALMRTDLPIVEAGLGVDRLVDDIMRSDHRTFGVLEGPRLAGLVSLEDVRKAPRSAWGTLTVAEIMTPLAELATVSPRDEARQALAELARRGVEQLPVLEDGEVVGVLRRGDIEKWLALQAPNGRGMTPAPRGA